ncbi:putative toxin-antitoxin system toxin component, PIN family [Chloroflexi bacterium TSY]|nr:putative toxin-antitoxin system toxin component, PIN family [Chloroflexi bacterium TSY]
MIAKIVIDTNVFVSALISEKGPNRQLLRKCFKGEYQPLMGNALFNEYVDLINRPKIGLVQK